MISNTTARKKCNDKKRDAGLVPVHEWVPAKDKEYIKKVAAKLRKRYGFKR